jgi:hypothetical protein
MTRHTIPIVLAVFAVVALAGCAAELEAYQAASAEERAAMRCDAARSAYLGGLLNEAPSGRMDAYRTAVFAACPAGTLLPDPGA